MRIVTVLQSLALTLSIIGCGSNEPATNNGAGGATSNGGATTVASSGGATTVAASGGAAGQSNTGAGGSGPSSGGAGGGATPTSYDMCSKYTTAAGAAPKKDGACAASDPQLCYNTCGPESKGVKSETCTNGKYAEQSGCTFPPADYACYKLPSVVSDTCPTSAPTASQPCTVDKCVVCGGTTGYLDSSGNSKTGYCVCQHDADGNPTKWSCASTTAWPCPAGNGC